MIHSRYVLALTLALPAPVAAVAQTAPVAAPEPARIEAAKGLIAKIMPVDRRDAMIEQMMRPMMASIRSALTESPALQEAFADDPDAKKMLDTFVEDEFAQSIALTKQMMPAMLDAMARAYARRFTVAQLNDISAFFDTPSGKLYAERATTIMSDPDVLAAQREMVGKSMQGTMERAQAMAAKLAEEQGKK